MDASRTDFKSFPQIPGTELCSAYEYQKRLKDKAREIVLKRPHVLADEESAFIISEIKNAIFISAGVEKTCDMLKARNASANNEILCALIPLPGHRKLNYLWHKIKTFLFEGRDLSRLNNGSNANTSSHIEKKLYCGYMLAAIQYNRLDVMEKVYNEASELNLLADLTTSVYIKTMISYGRPYKPIKKAIDIGVASSAINSELFNEYLKYLRDFQIDQVDAIFKNAMYSSVLNNCSYSLYISCLRQTGASIETIAEAFNDSINKKLVTEGSFAYYTNFLSFNIPNVTKAQISHYVNKAIETGLRLALINDVICQKHNDITAQKLRQIQKYEVITSSHVEGEKRNVGTKTKPNSNVSSQAQKKIKLEELEIGEIYQKSIQPLDDQHQRVIKNTYYYLGPTLDNKPHSLASNDASLRIGIMQYPNKAVYEGEWKNGKRHGLGTLTFMQDENDEKGRLTRIVENCGEWEDDVFVPYSKRLDATTRVEDRKALPLPLNS